jgi:hypothetical protein
VALGSPPIQAQTLRSHPLYFFIQRAGLSSREERSDFGSLSRLFSKLSPRRASVFQPFRDFQA